MKVGVYRPLPMTITGVFLLGYRFIAWLGVVYKNPRDNGMEVKPRGS